MAHWNENLVYQSILYNSEPECDILLVVELIKLADHVEKIDLENQENELNQILNLSKIKLELSNQKPKSIKQIYQNRLFTFVKYIADCCFIMCLKLEENADFLEQYPKQVLVLLTKIIKLFIKIRIDSFLIFSKLSLINSLLFDINQVNEFYEIMFKYISEKFAFFSSNYDKEPKKLKKLIDEHLYLKKIYLLLMFNHICFYEYSSLSLKKIRTETYLRLKLLTNNLKIIQIVSGWTSKDLNHSKIIDFNFKILNLMCSIIEQMQFFDETFDIINENDYYNKEKELQKKFESFYLETILNKDQFQYWMLTYLIQSYFCLFLKYLNDQKTMFKHKNVYKCFHNSEFFKFISKLCFYHFDSYSRLYSSNHPHLSQDAQLSFWYFTISFKNFDLVHDFYYNFNKSGFNLIYESCDHLKSHLNCLKKIDYVNSNKKKQLVKYYFNMIMRSTYLFENNLNIENLELRIGIRKLILNLIKKVRLFNIKDVDLDFSVIESLILNGLKNDIETQLINYIETEEYLAAFSVIKKTCYFLKSININSHDLDWLLAKWFFVKMNASESKIFAEQFKNEWEKKTLNEFLNESLDNF